MSVLSIFLNIYQIICEGVFYAKTEIIKTWLFSLSPPNPGILCLWKYYIFSKSFFLFIFTYPLFFFPVSYHAHYHTLTWVTSLEKSPGSNIEQEIRHKLQSLGLNGVVTWTFGGRQMFLIRAWRWSIPLKGSVDFFALHVWGALVGEAVHTTS